LDRFTRNRWLCGVAAHCVDQRGLVQVVTVGDHLAKVTEILDVEVRGERVQQDRRAVGRVGECVRRTRREHDQRPGWRVVGLGADREAGESGDHVEALVMARMAMLRRAVGVRREGDLAHAEPMVRGRAVLQDPHACRAQLD
jgi:hypothetical protein